MAHNLVKTVLCTYFMRMRGRWTSFWLVLALTVAGVALAQLGVAEDAGVGLSKRLICYTFSTIGGTIGLLVGFGISLYGLWTIIGGKTGLGLAIILGGAAVTAIPSLVATGLGGLQEVLRSGNISDRNSQLDAASAFELVASHKDNCESIAVNMSAYAPPPPGVGPASGVLGPDGRPLNPTGVGGIGSDITNPDDALQYAGRYIGRNQECVALVQELSQGVGHTSTWVPAGGVQGNDIPVGTPIATFNCNGAYCNQSGRSHAAIYLGQNSQGIQVLDQWNGSGGSRVRTIPWNNGNPYGGGSNYQVIGH